MLFQPFLAPKLHCSAECLHLLDETSCLGAAAASNVFCNRALVLMRHKPPRIGQALQDSTCAVDCKKDNSKVSFVRLGRVAPYCIQGASAHSCVQPCSSNLNSCNAIDHLTCKSLRPGIAELAVMEPCMTTQQHAVMLRRQYNWPGQHDCLTIGGKSRL